MMHDTTMAGTDQTETSINCRSRGLRAPNGQLFFAASRQSTGDFPVILRNSRLKFDRVLKPLESMAFVTASPAIKRSQAFSTRNPFT